MGHLPDGPSASFIIEGGSEKKRHAKSDKAAAVRLSYLHKSLPSHYDGVIDLDTPGPWMAHCAARALDPRTKAERLPVGHEVEVESILVQHMV